MQFEVTDAQKPLSQKERIRLQRRKGYDQAKEQRKTDPRFIALKAKQKQQRRNVYQKAKECAKAKKGEREKGISERAIQLDSARDQELMATLLRASQLKPIVNNGSESESQGEQ